MEERVGDGLGHPTRLAALLAPGPRCQASLVWRCEPSYQCRRLTNSVIHRGSMKNSESREELYVAISFTVEAGTPPGPGPRPSRAPPSQRQAKRGHYDYFTVHAFRITAGGVSISETRVTSSLTAIHPPKNFDRHENTKRTVKIRGGRYSALWKQLMYQISLFCGHR